MIVYLCIKFSYVRDSIVSIRYPCIQAGTKIYLYVEMYEQVGMYGQ